jgi:hypothetical protein
VLELDSANRILGGEWIDQPAYTWSDDGRSKRLHPDFLWMATERAGTGESANDTGGGDDDPYLDGSKIDALLDCADDPTTCAPGRVVDPDGGPSCAGHCGGKATADGQSCWCDSGCAGYGDCCEDYAAECTSVSEPASCAGHCDATTAVPGRSPACHCDSACARHGDCCSDYGAVCT